MSALSRMKALFRRATGKSDPEMDSETSAVSPSLQSASTRNVTSLNAARRAASQPSPSAGNEFSPSQTSSKGPFDKHRGEKLRDVESASYVTSASERWNDEDHYTNKSGDPRIGTHGRTYEGGTRNEKR